jgi:AcrR family transcriptional regulator
VRYGREESIVTTATARIDPRILRTRRLLFEAFTELMGEKAFEDISVHDITERATINRATFYAHFADKNALVDLLIAGGFARVAQQHLEPWPQDLPTYLREVLLAVAEYWSAVDIQCGGVVHPAFAALIEAQVRDQVRSDLREWLRLHREGGPAAARLDLTAAMASAALHGAVLERRNSGDTRTPERFAETALPPLIALIQAA